MAVTPDSFTEGRLRRRLGVTPERRQDGSFVLVGANLARLSLTKAQFAAADLRGGDLHRADLTRANLRGADLREADLSEATLHQADLSEADLRGADLRRAALYGTEVAGSHWQGALLDQAEFRDVPVWQCDLDPEWAAGVAALTLSGVIARLRPDDGEFGAVVVWCTRFGGVPELEALRGRSRDRAWRSWRLPLQGAVSELERRLGTVSAAALSRALPQPANSRSLSRGE